MNPQLECKEIMFMGNLSRYLRNKGFRGLGKVHVDHNVCPSCSSFKSEKDVLILQRAMLRDNSERVDDAGSTLEVRFREIVESCISYFASHISNTHGLKLLVPFYEKIELAISCGPALTPSGPHLALPIYFGPLF